MELELSQFPKCIYMIGLFIYVKLNMFNYVFVSDRVFRLKHASPRYNFPKFTISWPLILPLVSGAAFCIHTTGASFSDVYGSYIIDPSDGS